LGRVDVNILIEFVLFIKTVFKLTFNNIIIVQYFINNIIIYKFKIYVGSNPVTANYYLLYVSTNIVNINVKLL